MNKHIVNEFSGFGSKPQEHKIYGLFLLQEKIVFSDFALYYIWEIVSFTP